MPKSNSALSTSSQRKLASEDPTSNSRMSDVALRKKKNADAQAAFRARRNNYIATLEETGSMIPKNIPWLFNIKLHLVQSPASSPSFCSYKTHVERLEMKHRNCDMRTAICGMSFENAKSSGERYGKLGKQTKVQSLMICHLYQHLSLRHTIEMDIFTNMGAQLPV